MSKIAVYFKFPALVGKRAASVRTYMPRWILTMAIILLVSVSCLRAMPARAGAGSTVVSKSLVAGPYTLTLRIGPPLHLWTLQQAREMHPRDGDIILLGATAPGSTAMPNHHLDLHIALRTLGNVITNVVVAITVTTPTGTVVQRVPIAAMQGVGKGPSDTHFGNNISLQPGRYLVVVQVKRTTTTFDVTLTT